MLGTKRTPLILQTPTDCEKEVEFCIIFPSCRTGTSGKSKKAKETEVETPKNKKKISTPQTFPKANNKVGSVIFLNSSEIYLFKMTLSDKRALPPDKRRARRPGSPSRRQLFWCKGERPYVRNISQPFWNVNSPLTSWFCCWFREEPAGTGARKPTTSSSSPRASHSDMKRRRRRGGATAAEPFPPQSTPLGSTVTEGHPEPYPAWPEPSVLVF